MQFLFRAIMKHGLCESMERKSVLSKAQGGGRRDRCVDNEAALTRMACELSTHNKEEAIIVFLDAKAKVPLVKSF